MSSKSDRWVPTVNPGLPIPELIKILKHSFRESEFSEVQNILMDREKRMKVEMENLVRDRDSMEKEARLMERTHGLAELEKLKLEEKLQKSRTECEELNEKLKCLETRLVEMSQENEDLRHERLAANQTMEDLRHEKLAANQSAEELRQKQFEAYQVVEELKRQNLELAQTADELKLKKMESDEAAELYKSRYENLEPRLMKLEMGVSDFMNVKVEDIPHLVGLIEKFAAAEGQNVDLPDFLKSGKGILGNGSTDADAEDVVVASPGVRSTSNSTGSGVIGLPKKGSSNVVHSQTKEDGTDTVETSPGTQPGCSPYRVECTGTDQDAEDEEPQVSGPHASVMRSDGGEDVRGKSIFGARCSTKIAGPSSRDVIEICDSDDEPNPVPATYSSDRSSGQTNKRNRTDRRGDSPLNLIAKRKRRICISDGEDDLQTDGKDTGPPESIPPSGRCSSPSRREEISGAAGDPQTPPEKPDSPDSAGSCTETQINELLSTLQSKTRSITKP